MLFLNGENLLRECDEIDEQSELSNNVIVDYKKVKKRNVSLTSILKIFKISNDFLCIMLKVYMNTL